jgi:hypothetical protein
MEILVAWGDKMSDKKTSDLIAGLLTAFSESISPGNLLTLSCLAFLDLSFVGFTFKQMKKVIDKTKAPLAHQHFLEWLKVPDSSPSSHLITCSRVSVNSVHQISLSKRSQLFVRSN